ncbi:DsrE family protein [Pseudooceanicola nanhaiensis]|uniref:DsrE family protein n=1 Tax=Pseudooceanicola nanhaiensis TaxID=375761 RepID=UPI001CD2C652|nr:DsrE family protein [Pseudooceanicola nanhaiensis]MCA0920244.1 DsrE family protein [Pseudooceanicola nanhaiensis]
MIRTILAALAVLVAFALPGLAEGSRYGQQKVVYHINGDGGEGGKAYAGALNNVQNHINALGVENLEVRIVMHGNGVGLLKAAKENEKLQTQIGSLKSQNVVFNVCNNTLVGRKIDYENDLYDVWEQDIVPSGVAEIAYLQTQGFVYVKP